MNKNWILVAVGLALFVGAFFLTAAQDVGHSSDARGYPGWFCAVVTLIDTWGQGPRSSFGESPVQFLAMLFSGWINPLFLITLLAQLVRPKGRLAFVLRILLLFLFPACWVVFFAMNLYPREGYFVWIAGILLVVFTVPRARAARPAAEIAPAVDNRVSIS